jgi:antitoxin MazE
MFDAVSKRNYNVVMRSKLVAIGNSKGIRLPKALLQAARLVDAVDLRVEDGKLVITPVRRRRRPREGWAEAIQADIERNGVPEPDFDWLSMPNEWDAEGWRW